ncbi:MAG: hypothetical protein O3A87_05885 [Verrucomicrobia bacterium]|nr:hypothetical protein [Verrucomicrobiota bacterium]MDA1005998.1 hypothetical protein [Verrucomicrobiota bacterium]
MSVEVHRLPDDRVKLSVIVEQENAESFRKSFVFEADAIGPLNRLSFVRSGRTGGNARLDDLTMELIP